MCTPLENSLGFFVKPHFIKEHSYDLSIVTLLHIFLMMSCLLEIVQLPYLFILVTMKVKS